MVKKLSYEDHKAVEQAIAEAEKHCGAEIAVVVARTSDPYLSVGMACGLGVGSLVALGLWFKGIILSYPMLLCLQLACMALFVAVPFLRTGCIRFASSHQRRRRAAQRAAEEYLHAARHLSAGAPFVLLYVSLAERYTHLLASQAVREKISDSAWQGIIKRMTSMARSQGSGSAILQAVEEMAEGLSVNFPAAQSAPQLKNLTEL